MKIKITYNILLLLVFLAGCSKHPYPDIDIQTGRYIFFDAGAIETKGTLADNTSLKLEGASFGVYGYHADGSPIFNSYKVDAESPLKAPFDCIAKVYRPEGSTQTSPKPFTYDGLSTWTTGSHSFYAYYPYESSPTAITAICTDNTNGQFITYTQPTTLTSMADVMTARAINISLSDTYYSNGIVNLTFDHRLFALNVVLKNIQQTSQASIKLVSAKVEFTNLASGATFYFNGTTTPITSTTVSPSHTYNLGDGQTINNNDSFNLNSDTPFLFVPCSSLKVKITLSLINSWGETVEYTFDRAATNNALAPSGGFLAGYTYNLIIEKSDKSIDFAYNVEGWATPDIQLEFN